MGHRDAVSTLCPGEPLYGLIQDGVLKFSIYPPVELPTSDGGGEPVDIPEPGTGIEVGLTVDGRFGQSTVRVLQRRLGVTADGKAGSATWRALQAFLGTNVDGVVSNQSYTAEELGNGITGGWQYTGRNSSGSSMVRALQAYIGVSVDGVWGESTTRALQQHLNRYDSAFR